MYLPRPHRTRWLLLAVALLVCASAEAGLRDIHPRPQQMGLLAPTPAVLAGVPYLVIPSNPTADELRLRDEARRMIALRIGRVPEALTWSEYQGQTPVLWMGTLARFPQLSAALDSSGIAGVGSMTHAEEYQLVVEEQRILLGGSDLRGLRWGVQSLVCLMSEVMGRYYVDRAYIRDWPDMAKRVGTNNASVNTDDLAAWGQRVIDASYAARMNEIEWNCGLNSGILKAHIVPRLNALTAKLKNYGMALTVIADRTAKGVGEYHWREGVPVRDMPLVVTDSGLAPLANGYAVGQPNGSMETWVNGKPAGYAMYSDAYFGYVTRDTAIRHGGTSSVRITVPTGNPVSPELWQHIYVGRERMLRFRVWYRTANFKGAVRIRLLGTCEPLNRFEDSRVTFSTPTTQEWAVQEVEFRTFNADSMWLMVGPYGAEQGTVWLDDIEITTGGMQDIVRRADTPLDLYRQRQNMLMAEGVDYRVVETDTTAHFQYVRLPRLERIPGGRLELGDTVRLNFYCAKESHESTGGKQTPCFSMLKPLVAYQSQVAWIDSLLHPDGFKIHINEVSYANYDPLCTRRHLSAGQLVGSYCDQMYNIIQARRPGLPVRIYGDAFDIYASDSRAMPVVPGVPWNTGALQELSPAVELMAMSDYSSNLDSTIAYFAGGGHPCIVANALWLSYDGFLRAALAARRQGALAFQFYMWQGDIDSELEPRIQTHGDLAWNMGPYIVHQPAAVAARADSLVIQAEMWTDNFHVSEPVSLTATTLHYRILPGGSWTSVPLTPDGTDLYRGVIRGISSAATNVEYYLAVTDHRAQSRMAPADAPQKVFRVTFTMGGSAPGGDGGEEIPHSLRRLSAATVVEWAADSSVDWYEVHVGSAPDFSAASTTRLARQRPECARLLLPTERVTDEALAALRVYSMREHMMGNNESTKFRNKR